MPYDENDLKTANKIGELTAQMGNVAQALSTVQAIITATQAQISTLSAKFDQATITIQNEMRVRDERFADIEKRLTRIEGEIPTKVPKSYFSMAWSIVRNLLMLIGAFGTMVGAAWGIHNLHWFGF